MNANCEVYHKGLGWNGCGEPAKTDACKDCDYRSICKKRGFMPTCPLCGTALTPVRAGKEFSTLPPTNGGGLGEGHIFSFCCENGTALLAPDNGKVPKCPECGRRLAVIYTRYKLEYPEGIQVLPGEVAGYVCLGVLDGKRCLKSWAMTRQTIVRCPSCSGSLSLHIASGEFDHPRGDIIAVECTSCGRLETMI